MPQGALVEADTILRQLLEGILLESQKQTLILGRLLSLMFPQEQIEELTKGSSEGGTI